MKRRVISFLAILAMLCTMVVFGIPTTVAAETYTPFSEYTSTSTEKEWAITSKADWEAMRAVADAATSDYFEGYTFHLTGNVNFEFKSMLPLGHLATNEAAFAGTINGHGYGFEHIHIGTTSKTVDSSIPHAGLFFRLGNCKFIDFGLDSGLIYDNRATAASGMSSFGRVITGKTPEFTRVWSSIAIASMSKASSSGLVHTIDENNINLNVNGYVFDGEIIKIDDHYMDGQWSFAVTGHTTKTLTAGSTFANIITDFSSRNGTVTPNKSATVTTFKETKTNDPGVRAALFNFDTVANFKNSIKGNIYAVKRATDGINEGYFLNFRSGFGGSGSEELLTDMSAAEAAWTINNHPTTSVNPVYFTLKDGKVRPIAGGAQTGKIIKVTLTGDRNESFFFNAGTAVNLETDLKKTAGQTFTVGGSAISSSTYTVNADTEITVSSSCGDNHTYDSSSYVAGTNEHTATCTVCGVQTVELCSATSYTRKTLSAAKLAAGQASTHSGTCQHCGASFTHECSVQYTTSNNKKDHAWVYNCVCGLKKSVAHNYEKTVTKNGVEVKETVAFREMRPGDANGDENINALDAVSMLKKVVGAIDNVPYPYSADVDGNAANDIRDAHKIILYWLGDPDTKAEVQALAEKVQVLNYYDASKVEVGNIKMDGSDKGTNDRYVRTDNIAVSENNKLVFGPVRMQQAVMGYFYKADGTPLAVINRNNTNLKVTYEFADADGLLKEADLTDAGGTVHDESLGMVMANIKVPKDAAYVRFNVNKEEKDKYYIRINNPFSVGTYEALAKAETGTLGNPLKNQFVLNMGDSLADAAGDYPLRDPKPYSRLTGWSRRTMQQFNSKVVTSAKGGSTVSTITYQGAEEGAAVNLRGCVLNQLNEHSNSGRQFEYILLEGGGNDAGGGAVIGTFKENDYNPANFDSESTYSGALERLIYTAIQQHGDTAAIGYFVPYDMKHSSKAGIVAAKGHFDQGKAICEKWGIKCLDLFDISAEDENGNCIGTFDSKVNTAIYTENQREAIDKKYRDYLNKNGITKTEEEIAAQVESDLQTKLTENAARLGENGMTYDGIHALDAGYDIMFSYMKPFMLEMKPVSAEIYAQVQEYHKTNPLPTSYTTYTAPAE